MSMKISNDTIGNRNRDLPACSAVGGIMSMKNSNDTIGNQTCDLPACSAVPQPTALPRILINTEYRTRIILVFLHLLKCILCSCNKSQVGKVTPSQLS